MVCKACERRRKALAERRAKARGRKVEAAAIGAVLAASEAVGKAISGEVEDEQGKDEDKDDSDHSTGSD